MMHKDAGDFWCIGEDITVPEMEKRRGPKNEWGVTEGKGSEETNNQKFFHKCLFAYGHKDAASILIKKQSN